MPIASRFTPAKLKLHYVCSERSESGHEGIFYFAMNLKLNNHTIRSIQLSYRQLGEKTKQTRERATL